ncbi:AraC family transcriptional regulator [Thiomonas sp.]|uniref:helix-turn-helix transcriptional regulator n=1 Tax=Thiomonas sp. TaxID=2047785 RepID=UPI002626603B|nr:AraC family transcriptional regulator [Thiomonas sp.]
MTKQARAGAAPLGMGAEWVRWHRAGDLGGTELLSARFVRHRFAPHAHDTAVIALIEDGGERFVHRGQEHVATAGSLIVIAAGEVHTGERASAAGWAYRAFYPGAGVLDALLDAPSGVPPAALAFPRPVLRDPPLFSRLRSLHRLLHASSDALHRASAWQQAMGALLLRHAARTLPTVGAEPAAVRRAQELLRNDLAGRCTLHELARAVGLSPWYLNRAFSRAVGMPPHAWRNQWRLAQAKTLLRQGMPPAEVAVQLGFADQSHLHRHFKRAFGVTPGVFAQRKTVQDAAARRG